LALRSKFIKKSQFSWLFLGGSNHLGQTTWWQKNTNFASDLINFFLGDLPDVWKNMRISQIGHIVMSYLLRGENTMIFQKLSYCNGLPAQWKNTRIFFQKWSHCNGLPAQWEKTRGFFKSGHIVMLPRGEIWRFSKARIFQKWSHFNGLLAQGEKYDDFSKSGHIVMGYLPNGKIGGFFQKWSHCNGLPAQWKNTRIFSKVVTL